MKFYKDKRVVVTGGAGFVGIQLVRKLKKSGAHIIVLDDFSRGSNTEPGVEYYKTDVTNFDSCRFWFSKDIDAVFNLAATVAGVLHNENHQLPMYYDNLKVQTVPVMAADAVGVPHFLQTSSVCVYAPEHNAPSSEEYGLVGEPHPANAGYAESKRDGERLVQWSDIDHAVIVRPSNVFGPYDYFDEKAHVIPALIKRTLNEDPVTLYGNPSATREFVYSADVATGMMVALAKGKNKEAYNIGCHGKNTISMLDLLKLISDILGKNPVILHDTTVGGGDDKRYSNAGKLRSLGWEHKIALDWGIRATVDWYLGRST